MVVSLGIFVICLQYPIRLWDLQPVAKAKAMIPPAEDPMMLLIGTP